MFIGGEIPLDSVTEIASCHTKLLKHIRWNVIIWWDHVKYPQNPRETSYYDPHSWNSRHCPTFKKLVKHLRLTCGMLRIRMSAVKTWIVDPKKWGMVINPLIEVDIPTIYNLLFFLGIMFIVMEDHVYENMTHVYNKLGYTLKNPIEWL